MDKLVNGWRKTERQSDGCRWFWKSVTPKIHYLTPHCTKALKNRGVTACRKCDCDKTSHVISVGEWLIGLFLGTFCMNYPLSILTGCGHSRCWQ